MQVEKLPLHPKARILFENQSFFVLDKPAGILSHPNSKETQNASVIRAPYDPDQEIYQVDDQKAYLIHRIDKETSGCLLFAKNPVSAKKIKDDFQQHKVHKEYTALVTGILRNPVVWKDHLSKQAGKMRFDPRQQPNAITEVNILQIFEKNKLTLLKLSPKSGKTHQLRVQSSKRNLHILGDRQYGNFSRNKDIKTKFGLSGMFLHANSLGFHDHSLGQEVRVTSELPENFQQLLVLLR